MTSLLAVRGGATLALVLGLHLASASPAGAALASGVYQTLAGATVEEWGDRVPNQSRMVPLSATLTFDLSGAGPSLTAVIANAVLEGGDPFPLTVRSATGALQVDGKYWFHGDYLRDIYPSGTQYLFDWTFSASSNGIVEWNGTTGWAGGHAWYVTISNLTLVPVPWLTITNAGAGSVQITWPTNFADYVLEHTTSLPAPDWNAVTNAVSTIGDRLSVTADAVVPKRFYRLRSP